MKMWTALAGLGLAACVAGCLSVTVYQQPDSRETSHRWAKADGRPVLHRLRIVEGEAYEPVTGPRKPSGKRREQLDAIDALRAQGPDCGFPSQPLTILPGLGGDLITAGPGTVIIFDTGDTGGRATAGSHDRLVLPGFPDEAEIQVRNGSVAFCVPKYEAAVVVLRQACTGKDWNNSLEAVSFTGGVSFVSQEILDETGGAYMTRARAQSTGLDWLSAKGLKNWTVYPMPAELLAAPGTIPACDAPAPDY